MVFLNGGPGHQLNPAFSFFIRCDSQEEIDGSWTSRRRRRSHGLRLAHRPLGLCSHCASQYRRVGSHPKAMQAMMGVDQDGPAHVGSPHAES